MKYLFTFCLLFTALAQTLLSVETTPSKAPGIVILELFTSEGCSSCPPTEKKLQQFIQSTQEKGLPIHLISYHVTVWDKLKHGDHGMWKDRYGDVKFTELLKAYSAIHPHPAGVIATPSIFVNGAQSASKKINTLIDEALQTPTSATISAAWDTNGKLTYNVTGGDKDAQVIFVLRESKISSQVTAGENHDKTLTHDFVARWRTAMSLATQQSGTVDVHIPENIDRRNADLLIFIQQANLGVQGVTVQSLPTI